MSYSPFQSQIIDEVIGPGLINPRNTCYINSLVQLLSPILSLRLMIVAWPNRDPIISTVRLIFVAMSQISPLMPYRCLLYASQMSLIAKIALNWPYRY
jgi:hypothetical protein